jgi:predicted nuclease of predicted toxin-antitoxin system
MRLLLDENLSPAVSGYLVEAGHDVVHVRDCGLTSATDEVVLAQAVVEKRVLVSADTDFGTLLARSGAAKPSVVLIRRTVGRRAAQQARLLIDNLPEVQVRPRGRGRRCLWREDHTHPPAAHLSLPFSSGSPNPPATFLKNSG